MQSRRFARGPETHQMMDGRPRVAREPILSSVGLGKVLALRNIHLEKSAFSPRCLFLSVNPFHLLLIAKNHLLGYVRGYRVLLWRRLEESRPRPRATRKSVCPGRRLRMRPAESHVLSRRGVHTAPGVVFSPAVSADSPCQCSQSVAVT